MSAVDWRRLGYCWIGSARYTCPLDPTSAKKWAALAELGVELYVISFAGGLRPRHFKQSARFYLLPQAGLPVLRYLTLLTLAPLIALGLVLRGKAHVLIAQSPYEGVAAAWTKRMARLMGKRVALIVENHGDFEVSVFLQRRDLLAGLYRRIMPRAARYTLQHADVLRAISSMTENQIRRWAPHQPLERFMTWTDVDAFAGAERQQALTQTHDVVYAGVLIPRKGVHLLLEAFASVAQELPDARLWLVGRPDDPPYVAQLHQQVERLGLGNRVTFVGNVSQADLAGHLRRARVLVLPSLSEGLGRVVVEAMLCGTPVIGSKVGGIPDMIQDGVNGYLVPPGDVAALSGALLTVLRDPEIEQMGARARAFAQQFFSTAAYVDGYRRLFEHAAAQIAPLR